MRQHVLVLEAAEPISSEQPDGRFGLWSIPRLRRRIRLSLAEIRRLFNVRDQVKQIIHAAMGWSDLRRHHQANARRRTSSAASRSNT